MKFKIAKNDPLKILYDNWHDCTRCPLGERARNHVLYEVMNNANPGDCDVMFVGEGPGESEDVLGRPFIGKAGKVLREGLNRISDIDGYKIVITNIVACRPQTEEGKNREPFLPESEACWPRLKNLIEIFKPICLVALGKFPDSFLSYRLREVDKHFELYKTCYHPSYIVRNGGLDSQKGQWFQYRIQECFDDTIYIYQKN